MAFSDYLKGPFHKREAEDLRRQREDLQRQLKELQDCYEQIQALAKKYGAMEVQDVRRLVEQEQAGLESVRQQVKETTGELSSLRNQLTDLRSQVLVVEETLLLESFALYEPKFKLTASHEYKTRIDTCRERQKAMIKGGTAATGNLGWEVNGSKAEGRKLVNDMMKLVCKRSANSS